MRASRSISARLAILLAAALATGGAAHAQPAAGDADSARDTVNVVLTVSGGISLGSYESGANWALGEFLRRSQDPAFQQRHQVSPHRLVVATGASAGNINALLSSLRWCAPGHDAEPAEQSLFWKLWTGVGMAQLFPNDEQTRAVPRRYDRRGWPLPPNENWGTDSLPGYGVFLRDSMRNAYYPEIRAQVGSPREARCNVTLGVTLTKMDPDSIALNPRIFPRAQRFASIFQVHTRDGADGRRLVVALPPPQMRADTALGMLMVPLGDSAGAVPVDTVLKVVEASSAFPLAFQPVMLRYHPSAASPCTHPKGCDGVRKKALFIDGGVFDNNPLGLGLQLYRRLYPEKASEVYIYIDPAGMRKGSDRDVRFATAPQTGGTGLGLSAISALLGGAVPAAREYELHALARDLTGDPRRARITTTDRAHRLVSSHLGAFAGFLGRPFREYDFYVGVYDGLYFVARDILCAHGHAVPGDTVPADTARADTLRADTARAKAACTRRGVVRLLTEPDLRLSLEALTVMGQLYREEYGVSLPGGVERPRTRQAALLLAVDAALDSTRDALPCNAGSPVARAMCRDGFIRFVRYLSDTIPAFTTGLPPGEACASARECAAADPVMVELLGDPERYLARLASRVIDRMDNVERGLRHNGMHRGVALAGAIYHMVAGEPRRGFEKDPSSVPDTRGTAWRSFTHVLPYYVGFGANVRRVEAGFRPGFYYGRGTALVAPILPLHLAQTRDGRERAFLAYGAGFHLPILGPIDLEDTYQQVRPWADLDRDPPVNTIDAAVLLGEKFRVSARRVVSDRGHVYSRAVAISLGIVDLNGLIYWAGRVAH